MIFNASSSVGPLLVFHLPIIFPDHFIAQIESFYVNGPTPNSEFDIFIFRSESLYIARAIVYEVDQYGTIDTDFKTLMNGFSQEGVLGAFEDLWERLQIKFSPYLEEFVKVEKSVTSVRIMDKEADKHPEEMTDSVEEKASRSRARAKRRSRLRIRAMEQMLRAVTMPKPGSAARR